MRYLTVAAAGGLTAFLVRPSFAPTTRSPRRSSSRGPRPGPRTPVTIPFEETGTAVDPFGNTRVGFEGATTINRKDWDLT
ncbi:hypothetical protein ACNKF0_09065 [Nocardioides sp. T5]|uniref:hypothetical protein n=1 Tax=Nocardioides sp. T5 TaxID=3400182 RepID=UPI003A890486